MTHIKTWQERAGTFKETYLGSAALAHSDTHLHVQAEINELRAVLAGQGEPVEYQMLILGQRWTHCAKHIYDAAVDRSTVRALYTAAPAPHSQYPEQWAKMLHYPECWDTAAYPELRDAIHEALAWSGCSVCKPATQPAQEPLKFLANNTRFKLSFDPWGRVLSLSNFEKELDQRWVALVAAEDDCHLQSALPGAAQPITKTRIGNHLRALPMGEVGMYRNGFKDGVQFAEASHGITKEAVK